MIVAPSATRSQTEHRTRDGINLLVDVVHGETHLEPLIHVLDTQCEKTRRHILFNLLLRRTRGQQVPGDLFANELVIGLIAVERIDDIVAVTPGMGVRNIA